MEVSNVISLHGEIHISIDGLCFDSRHVEKNSVFFALVGTEQDGHAFIQKAVENGAVAVVCQQLPLHIDKHVTYIQVKDTSIAMGFMASAFYENPSSKLSLIGITGTNGKTTTVTLLYRLFRILGYKVGLLSTIENRIEDEVVVSSHTTGDAIEINRLLSMMVEKGCSYVFMEVSSHAVVQNRIAGLNFVGAIFSNITRDHLDYHKTFEAYIKAKKQFFDNLPANAFALTNIDDKNGAVMIQNTRAHKYTYSLRTLADFKCKVLEDAFSGLLLEMDHKEVFTSLVGRFNAYNLTAIYAVACLLGKDKIEVLCALSQLQAASGRFQILKSKHNDKTAIVDYAHTPDALQNVLTTINEIRSIEQILICVVGAGGNRDTGKRPIMAEIAAKYADKVILTSDNPRMEDPQEILNQMDQGIDKRNRKKVIQILNREEAIKAACFMAGKDDIILVAGKGHETYQEIQGVKHHFDDREVITKYID
ncbi:MAG: UDP-N-acetylmuramoyl-L-alanyl-D-glutamate--2,6-diaminopimelate ligase [Bacteroidales bacterium]